MDVNKGEEIILVLQLIQSDGVSSEEYANVSYRIFDSTGTVEVVSSQIASYNSTTKSFMHTLNPGVLWPTQEVGHYLIIWSVSDTEDVFDNVYTEQLNINIDKTLIDRILGLVHQNIEIDETVFDKWHNLESARVRIFSDSAKINILATYRINCNTTGPGQFSSWTQVEE